ncbi:hypothetical protein PVK06_021145 [Gossypium arboreum]|uniref:Uncharacterized protein n=1 Tax=Gossypium arboreum TaxID=29729 RepID=A0ABR0PPG1_GOSAR|nr:hypothetical protein PVK06_021145 [Gossypium arboreum]
MEILDVEKVIAYFEVMTKDVENVQRETLKMIWKKMDASSICRIWASMAELTLKASRLMFLSSLTRT